MDSRPIGVFDSGFGGLTVYSPSEGSAITKSEATVGNVSLSTTDRFTLTSTIEHLQNPSTASVVVYDGSDLAAGEFVFDLASFGS